RVQHLKITARLCELTLQAEDTAANPEMLRIITADHARDLPDIKFRRGVFELERWRDTALKLLADLEPRDEEIRRESAGRLAQRDDYYQLFGLPGVIEGMDAPARSWRESG